jgi:hypothetical protein
MKKSVSAVLLAVAVLAATPAGTGILPTQPYNAATTSVGPALTAGAGARVSAPVSARGATRSRPWDGRSVFVPPDVLIDSGFIRATAADYEMDGTMWVAYSKLAPDSGVYVSRSTDHGATWSGVIALSLIPTTLVTHLGMVVGQGDSAFVYLFVVHPNEHGDLLCARFNKDGSDYHEFWVKADADSINDFKVCRDYSGSGYALYCVAGNDDHGSNFDDFFLKSTDYGKTWTALSTFRFVSDGSLAAGSGSYLYMAGRPGFSSYYGQLNLLVNSYWADPDSWREVGITPDTFYVMDPVIAPSFATPAASATIWTLYSHNFNGTGDMDMMYIYSRDVGTTWSAAHALASTSGANEQYGDIKPYTDPGNTWMNASYISEAGDRTVFRHYCEQSAPDTWSDTLRINSHSAGTGQEIRPLLVYSPGATGTGAGCVFTGAGLNSIYWNSPWTPGIAEGQTVAAEAGFALAPNPAADNVRFALPRISNARIAVYDPVGREVVRLPATTGLTWDRTDAHGNRVPAGVYIVRLVSAEGSAARRLVLR